MSFSTSNKTQHDQNSNTSFIPFDVIAMQQQDHISLILISHKNYLFNHQMIAFANFVVYKTQQLLGKEQFIPCQWFT
jgi:hypothetical protein